MVNGLGVLGYGVGGIEAEAVLLGQPLYQPMPRVVGVRLHGELPRGSTATDLVLVVTEMLRAYGVVGAFVEFAGDGLAGLALADRATISNMSPEFGATATLFPIDDETLALPAPDRPGDRAASPSSSATPGPRACGASQAAGPDFDEPLELDLATVEPSRRRSAPAAGPGRSLGTCADNFRAAFPQTAPATNGADEARIDGEGGRPDGPERRGDDRDRWTDGRRSARARSRSPRSPRARTPRTRRSWSAPACSPATRSPAA